MQWYRVYEIEVLMALIAQILIILPLFYAMNLVLSIPPYAILSLRQEDRHWQSP